MKVTEYKMDKTKEKSKSKKVIQAYRECECKTDVLGSYTGNVKGNKKETPTQDADDL